MNNGFVPILEIPNPEEKSGVVITESLFIMEFLDRVTGEETFCKNIPMLKERIQERPSLYSKDPKVFAKQKMLMHMSD